MAATLLDFWQKGRKRNHEDQDEENDPPSKKSLNSIELCKDVQNDIQSFAKPLLGLNVVYFPNCFSRAVACTIFTTLEQTLKDSFSSPSVVKIFGKVQPIPRERAAFGDVGLSYSFSGVKVHAKPWTPCLLELKRCVEDVSGESFNFVLVNRYKDGSHYIGEHRDDEADLCPKSTIASLSFGQERDFIFRHKDTRGKNAKRKDIPPVKLALAHGSLLLMKHPTNSNWYHSLPLRKKVAGCRINLTFRRMIKHDEL